MNHHLIGMIRFRNPCRELLPYLFSGLASSLCLLLDQLTRPSAPVASDQILDKADYLVRIIRVCWIKYVKAWRSVTKMCLKSPNSAESSLPTW